MRKLCNECGTIPKLCGYYAKAMREVFENNMQDYGKLPENRTQNMHKLGEGYAGTLNKCQATQKAVPNSGENYATNVQKPNTYQCENDWKTMS